MIERSYTLAQTANGTVNRLVLGRDLALAGVDYSSFVLTGSDLIFKFLSEPSVETVAQLDGLIAAHVGEGTPLALAKSNRIVFVDLTTAGKIESGVLLYDGQEFSISKTAQFNTFVMFVRRNEPGFAYPVVRANKTNTGTVSLPDVAAVEAFYTASETAVRALLDAGTALKTIVNACGSVAEVAAFVDPR